MSIKKIFILTSSAWILLVSTSFVWNYYDGSKEKERVALESSRTFFEYITMTRQWNARHNGVYAPITEATQPNPYLQDSLRDIPVNEQLTLTKINPAYMTRQISEIAHEKNGVQFHMSSLKPINPINQPTELEAKILHEFDRGLRETGMFINENGHQYYFYMAALIAEKPCLVCHAQQGYKEGDVRGAISVTYPYSLQYPFQTLFFGHLLIAITGLILIFLATRTLTNAYQIIQRQATIDEVTGLPNRRYLADRLKTEFGRHLREHQSMSLIMCDIDKFKIFNDHYGHLAGDKSLHKVAQTIQTTLKRPSDFCARFGGEEFIILLPDTELDGATYLAEKLRAKIEALKIPNKKALHSKFLTISLGVATLTEDKPLKHYETLIKQADDALYEAKRLGRNQVQEFEKMSPKSK